MKRKLLILLCLTLFINTSFGQSVGLVLSGGGAKGIAHIEIIRILEESGIPIDYVAGTSIGAIVGGLYAAGFSPDEMEQLFRSDDFYFWSTGRIQKEFRYFFNKPDPNPSWFEFALEKRNDKLTLLPPSSIIPEEQMDFAFMELLAATNAACKNNFDSLMVPFFCVAADVHSNQPAVLRKGDLGEAIRASMTFPLYFQPIMIDGKLLFDGGIVNNFPHDLMEEIYSPDIIIGHKVADEPKEPSYDNVMEQIMNIVMRPTQYEISPEKGILLETELSNISLLDFHKYDFIVEQGRNTIEPMIDSIKSRIERRISPETVQKRRNEFSVKKPDLYFQNVQVEGVKDPMQRKFIIQSIKHRYNIVSLNSLKEDYFKLITDEHIKSIRPLAYYNPESGYYDLHLKVIPDKKIRINIGGNISTKPINQGFGSFDYRTYKNRAYTLSSNIYYGRFYSSFLTGGRIDFPTSRPLYLSAYMILNRWDFFSSSSELFFEDVRPPYIKQGEYNFRAETGIPVGLHSKLYAGAAISNSRDEYYQTDIFLKQDIPDITSFSAFSSQLGFENNSLNYKQYATEGSAHSAEFKYITGRETNRPGSTSSASVETTKHHEYLLLQLKGLRHFKLFKNFTFATQLEATLSNKKLFKNYRSTMLNAPCYCPTPHSQSLYIENFRSDNYLAGGLKLIYNFNPSLHLRVESHGFVPMYEVFRNEDLTAYKNEKLFSNYYLQGITSLVYHTGFGPASVSLSYYEKPNTNFYFTLNFGYILFNKKGY